MACSTGRRKKKERNMKARYLKKIFWASNKMALCLAVLCWQQWHWTPMYMLVPMQDDVCINHGCTKLSEIKISCTFFFRPKFILTKAKMFNNRIFFFFCICCSAIFATYFLFYSMSGDVLVLFYLHLKSSSSSTSCSYSSGCSIEFCSGCCLQF
jgi:hypothetical protein